MPHQNSRDRFTEVYFAILAGEPWGDRYRDLSFGFQIAAATLFRKNPNRAYQYFDGVADLMVWKRSDRKVEFKGGMWVGNDNRRQWTEPFRATLIDKRITKQGLWLTMEVGEDRGEGEIADLIRRRSD